jgi:hypothetical protein
MLYLKVLDYLCTPFSISDCGLRIADFRLQNSVIILWIPTSKNPQSAIHNPKPTFRNPKSTIRNRMTFLLELLKISIPAIVVGGTVWMMLKQYFQSQYQLRLLEQKKQNSETTLPLRLQAYERLSLLCERISIPNLLARLGTDGVTVNDLRTAMLIAIRQEFEHNITQQIYVSENLWSIVKVARDNTAEIVHLIAQKLDPKADVSVYIAALFEFLESQEADSLLTAQMAIRQEATQVMS